MPWASGATALQPMGNSQVSHYFLNLHSGKYITQKQLNRIAHANWSQFGSPPACTSLQKNRGTFFGQIWQYNKWQERQLSIKFWNYRSGIQEIEYPRVLRKQSLWLFKTRWDKSCGLCTYLQCRDSTYVLLRFINTTRALFYWPKMGELPAALLCVI